MRSEQLSLPSPASHCFKQWLWQCWKPRPGAPQGTAQEGQTKRLTSTEQKGHGSEHIGRPQKYEHLPSPLKGYSMEFYIPDFYKATRDVCPCFGATVQAQHQVMWVQVWLTLYVHYFHRCCLCYLNSNLLAWKMSTHLQTCAFFVRNSGRSLSSLVWYFTWKQSWRFESFSLQREGSVDL